MSGKKSLTEINAAAAAVIAAPFIAALEAGEIPWEKPWTGGRPPVSIDGREYRGLNPFLLDYERAKAGWKNPIFLTMRRANELGGKVRKGEHPTRVSFWKMLEKQTGEDDENGEPIVKQWGMLRYYFLFNAEQCEFPAGVLEKYTPPAEEIPELTMPEEIETAGEAVWDGYEDRPTRLPEAGGRAFYRPSTDALQMPPRERFKSAEGYYSVFFHEMTHSTGHEKRLGRITNAAAYGDEEYGKEELVAELGSALLCRACGFTGENTERNHLAYVQNWAKGIKANPTMLITAAAAAQKAVDWIRGKRNEA